MKIFVVFWCAVVIVAAPRWAFADGNELLSKCIQAERVANGEHIPDAAVPDAMACLAYLNGVSDLNMLYRAGFEKEKIRKPAAMFCSPNDGVRNDQLTRVVVKFLKANPGRLHESEVLLVVLALSEAFPCRP